MAIIITQPFNIEASVPNFTRDVINSSLFENKSPNKLTAEESTAFGIKYDIGHVVWDIATKRHYSVEKHTVLEVDVIYLKPLEPMVNNTSTWASSGYVPYDGEIVIYNDVSREITSDGSVKVIPMMKIGDGTTAVSNLEFVGAYADYAKTAKVADKVSHKLTIGEHVFDGSEDVTVKKYNGEAIIL